MMRLIEDFLWGRSEAVTRYFIRKEEIRKRGEEIYI
jgi:hypothetical protein